MDYASINLSHEIDKVIMSGRKRPARHDPSDQMHWNKKQYIHHLKETGISVKSTWRLDIIRHLYFENHKNAPQSEGEVPQDTININDNTSTEPSNKMKWRHKYTKQIKIRVQKIFLRKLLVL